MSRNHNALRAVAFPVLTAQEFIAQGTGPAAILSIARSSPAAAAELRATARIVARLTGVDLGGVVRPANDNARKSRPAVAAGRRAA